MAVIVSGCSDDTNALDSVTAEHHDDIETDAVIVGVFDEDSQVEAAVGRDGNDEGATPDRTWQTASLGKVVTAAAILQLVDRGRLNLDDPADDYTTLALDDSVTLRHLLQHRTTLPSTDEFFGACTSDDSIESLSEMFADPSQSTAGPATKYANANYVVLGRIIADITSEDPGHHIRDTIFRPVGMEDTYWDESQVGETPFSVRADVGDGEGLFGCALGPTVGTDGALVTSMRDMDAFFRALFASEIVSDEALADMLDLNQEVFGYRFGLGLIEMIHEDHPDDVLYGFGGSGDTYGTAAFHDPSTNRTVVVYTVGGDQIDIMWDAIDAVDDQTQ